MNRFPFYIGDRVRLTGGWTQMVIIGIVKDVVYAQYWYPSFNPTQQRQAMRNFRECASQERHYTEFVHWDGHPEERQLNQKKATPMPSRYRSILDACIEGVLVGHSTNGGLIIELDNGKFEVIKRDEAVEVIPKTFKVKAMFGAPHMTNFLYPITGNSVRMNDMLISDSGNIYLVVDDDSRARNPNGPFLGKRLVQQDL